MSDQSSPVSKLAFNIKGPCRLSRFKIETKKLGPAKPVSLHSFNFKRQLYSFRVAERYLPARQMPLGLCFRFKEVADVGHLWRISAGNRLTRKQSYNNCTARLHS